MWGLVVMLPDDVLLAATFDFCTESEASRCLKFTFGNQYGSDAGAIPRVDSDSVGGGPVARRNNTGINRNRQKNL